MELKQFGRYSGLIYSLKMSKKDIYFLLGFLPIFYFAFRDLLDNIQTNLIDRFDYPLQVWIIYNNVNHIINGDIKNFFNTNAFYPHTNTLFFSDLLLPQTLFALPLSLLFDNPILVFNLVFTFTILLNYLSGYILFRKIFRKNHLAFFGGILLTFSPFVHSQLSHFQLLNFWPSLFAIYFLNKNADKFSLVNAAIIATFLSIQFLSSVYLAVFLIVIILIYQTMEITKMNFKKTLTFTFLIFLLFGTLNSIFIKEYLDTKNQYGIERSVNERISYSAHLTDYVFTGQYKSFIYQFPFFRNWDTLNRHHFGELAVFPGITLLLLLALVIGKDKILRISKDSKHKKISVFFLFTGAVGLIFSLGPKLNINGSYAYLPLPYSLLHNLPVFDSIRAPARWSLLFYLSTTFFSVLLIDLLRTNSIVKFKYLFAGIFVIAILEYIPFNLKTLKQNPVTEDYQKLAQICEHKKLVLLELPVTHFDTAGSIGDGLSYISSAQLASIHHKCYLKNGYSGFDLPELKDLNSRIIYLLEKNEAGKLITQLKEKEVDLIKINRNELPEKYLNNFAYFESFLQGQNGSKISEDVYLINSAEL